MSGESRGLGCNTGKEAIEGGPGPKIISETETESPLAQYAILDLIPNVEVELIPESVEDTDLEQKEQRHNQPGRAASL